VLTLSAKDSIVTVVGRPYAGSVVEDDPQRRLALRDPTLPNGKTLPGFLGYAVNIIDVDVDHLQTKTIAGHGLREILFYRLFGELQLYETKELMKQAHGCITGGAVSLDGGFIYGNGMFLLGRKYVFFIFLTSEQGDATPQTTIGLKFVKIISHGVLKDVFARLGTNYFICFVLVLSFQESGRSFSCNCSGK